jgi:hypothetical protein
VFKPSTTCALCVRWALFQWSEVFSLLLLAALLATGVHMHFKQVIATATLLGVCPGIHITIMVNSRLCQCDLISFSVLMFAV